MAGPRYVAVPTRQISSIPLGLEQGAKYVLVGPTGVRASFNDPDDIDHVGFLTEPPSGLDGADVRESADTIPDDDGGVHGAFYEGRRPWTLTGLVDPTPGPLQYDEVLRRATINLVGNGSFEKNASDGWSYTTGAAGDTTSSPNATDGARVGRLTRVADGNGPLTITAYSDRQPIPPNAIRLYVSGMVGKTATADRATVNVYFYDGPSGSSIGSAIAVDSNVTPWAGTYSFQNVPVDVPDGTSHVALAMRYSNAAEGSRIYYDSLMLLTSAFTDLPFFNGDTAPGGDPIRTVWLGDPLTSRSYFYNVLHAPWSAARVGNDRMDKLRQATAALRDDSVLQWTPEGGVELALRARRQQPPRFGQRLPKTFLLAMVSANPRIESRIVNVLTADRSAGIASTNIGTRAAPPTITLTGPWTNPQITNQTNGGVLRFNLTMVAGDVLELNAAARTVLLNGVNRYDALVFPASDYFGLEAGTNALVASGGAAGATWSVAWRDAWG